MTPETGVNYTHGIYMAGFSTDVWIQNNIFEGGSPSEDHTATGIALKNVTNLYLTGNVISGYNYCAINPADFPNERLFIMDNTIRDMNYLKLVEEPAPVAERIFAAAAGIVINWATKVLILNNIFEHIKHTGIYDPASN